LGAVQAILLDSELRGVHTKDLMVAWEKEIGAIPGVKSLTFEGMEAGPPGAPIEVWLQGNDMPDILAASDRPHGPAAQIRRGLSDPQRFLARQERIAPGLKPEARTLGVTVEDLARQVYAGYYGDEACGCSAAGTTSGSRCATPPTNAAGFRPRAVRIRTPRREVPLLSVADIQIAPGYSTITRTDGMRRVAVSAGVDTNPANANEIFASWSASFFPS
jgi:multidrug efflux pump subunit AcrB